MIEQERTIITRIRPLYLGPALGEARAAATTDAQRRALNKAVPEILGGSAWTYDHEGHVFTVPSRTRANVTYWTRADACSCPAGATLTYCWHLAAAMLVRRAVELEDANDVSIDYEQALAEVGGF